jgi:hypothetical protein
MNDAHTTYGRSIYQAQGMVSVQADCPMNEALALIKERAASDGLTLEALANRVIDRSLRFGE